MKKYEEITLCLEKGTRKELAHACGFLSMTASTKVTVSEFLRHVVTNALIETKQLEEAYNHSLIGNITQCKS